MKRKYEYMVNDKKVEREVNYIPFRYIFAFMITILEICAIISTVFLLCYFVPYFYIAAFITEIFCVISIVSSNDNPDYKVPWLLVVLILPIVGFMIYFLFYRRTLKRKYIKRQKEIDKRKYEKDDTEERVLLRRESQEARAQANMIMKISNAHLFKNTKQEYFKSGEDMHASMLYDLENAQKFIYMEYFIIEEGKLWNSVLHILKQKARDGVEVRVVYDDIGCMSTLPGNYAKILAKDGIMATPFSRMKGGADSEFNNRNHRKITVIDGYIGYTGGINLADEYINEIEKFGHWKDTAIRLEGEAVWELTRLFLNDYSISVKKLPEEREDLYSSHRKVEENGYIIPFGDGPRPLYDRNVGKSIIQAMLYSSKKYMYITTPYLIIDNELCQSIENAALRGIDVRIVVPHIPDKKFVFGMTKSTYARLIGAGVRIYEYKPGFIHAKMYLSDDEYAMIGTINLDYRSLVHHFENGVWMYKTDSIKDIKADIEDTIEKSIEIKKENLKTNLFTRFIRAIVRIFAPLL
ncbi:MAG: cardiolipin synthase [Clostridia bacterium]|nr:cardiolipin synthase [Clostridia bacterium]